MPSAKPVAFVSLGAQLPAAPADSNVLSVAALPRRALSLLSCSAATVRQVVPLNLYLVLEVGVHPASCQALAQTWYIVVYAAETLEVLSLLPLLVRCFLKVTSVKVSVLEAMLVR